MNPLAGRLAAWAARVDQRLPDLLPPADARPERVHAAMHYALTTPGKRLRPVLTLAVAELFGGTRPEILDLACAIEMVHASSLVLDDLPCMDDAAMRRGRPTVHRAFTEDVALLAAFGLLNRAYALVAENGLALGLRRYTPADLAHHLAAAVGTDGLIGGQALDLEMSDQKPPTPGRPANEPPTPGRPVAERLDLGMLEYIHSHKTGALFLAAAELGAMAADARRRDLETVSRYAKNLGLAFQISDDLLDVLATPEETGKDAHQDAAKVTFVKLLGVEGARALEAELLGFAVAALEPLGRKADALRALAEFVRVRRR